METKQGQDLAKAGKQIRGGREDAPSPAEGGSAAMLGRGGVSSGAPSATYNVERLPEPGRLLSVKQASTSLARTAGGSVRRRTHEEGRVRRLGA